MSENVRNLYEFNGAIWIRSKGSTIKADPKTKSYITSDPQEIAVLDTVPGVRLIESKKLELPKDETTKEETPKVEIIEENEVVEEEVKKRGRGRLKADIDSDI